MCLRRRDQQPLVCRNPDCKVRNLLLADNEPLRTEWKPDLLKGINVVNTKAVALSFDANGNVSKRPEQVTAIPYYAWANRGRGQMAVWVPDSEASARPAPYPTLATTAKVTVSGKSNKSLRAINDGEEPTASDDPSSYFDWWPVKGAQEWVEYAFEKPATVSECEFTGLTTPAAEKFASPRRGACCTKTATNGSPS